MLKRFFDFIRKRTTIKSGYLRTYLVMVYIQHPQVGGSINKFYIKIDANSRDHAIKRLQQEVTFKFGRPKEV